MLERENALVEQKKQRCREQMERHKQRLEMLEKAKRDAKNQLQRYVAGQACDSDGCGWSSL